MAESITFNNTLCPELNEIAMSLHSYANTKDFSLHKKIAEAAYKQVVNQSGVKFSSNTGALHKRIIEIVTSSESTRNTGKELAQIANGKDFKWPLYEKCVALCKQHNIDIVEFIAEPTMPTTITEALTWLKVPEIKSILKTHGYNIGGKRVDLESRMIENIELQSIDSLLKDKYDEKIRDYQTKQTALKYELLSRYITFRAYFLRDICKHPDASVTNFRPELLSVDNREAEEMLGRLIDGTGFDNVIVNGLICKPLPLFPCSLTDVTYKYQKKPSNDRSRTPKQRLSSQSSLVTKLRNSIKNMFM